MMIVMARKNKRRKRADERWRLGDLVAYRVRPEHVPFIVPYEAHSLHIGQKYFEDLARTAGGRFKRNPPDFGLMDDLDVLAGPTFQPRKVHPLVRDFYERTTRYTLAVRPVWNPLFQPAFWIFRKALAERIGQCNLPFDAEEAGQGIVSYIDTIDFDGDGVVDLRGWVRTFKGSGHALYVGIYTTFRHDGVGYVSVGFPLPEANLTATLVPSNRGQGGLLLRTHFTGTPFAGDYLAAIDDDDGDVSVLKLDGFEEEIEVYVQAEQLLTDHRFYLLGANFLTLHYTILPR